ncbi:MAG: CDP-alcohol phosphatidyltransferase [Chloroflexi bacterium]|nr:MAG: CDP-alcohol phosphatidyltransferase [Chloroflexota bacterium]
MISRRAAAWLVHGYTAMGGVLGVFALFTASKGDYREAFLFLVLTTMIDATDGLMARLVRVWEVLPNFDGAMMDNVIDVLTFLWVPVFILMHAELIPHPSWAVVPVVAGMYAYGQVNMKTPDSYFLGFPTYWNVIALYFFWIQPVDWIAVGLLIFFAILTFIPTRYLYPSRNRILWKTTWSLAGIWLLMICYLLLQENPNHTLIWISLYFPVYYMLASFWVDWKIRRGELRVFNWRVIAVRQRLIRRFRRRKFDK